MTYEELLACAQDALAESYTEESRKERQLCVARANAYTALATEIRKGLETEKANGNQSA